MIRYGSWPGLLLDRVHILGAVLFLGIVLTACRVPEPNQETILDTATPAHPAATRTPRWRLTFEITGGFIAINQVLALDSNGQLIAMDLGTGQTLIMKLTEEELADFERLLNESLFFSQSDNLSQGCVDCFDYRILLIRGDQIHSVRATDLGLDDSLKSLVSRLSELAFRARRSE